MGLRRMSFLWGASIPLALAIALLSDALWSPLSILSGDSPQYLEFAQAIKSGAIFLRSDSAPYGLVLRTPGFPIILCLAQIISPKNLAVGLVVMHGALALFTLTYVMFVLRDYISPILSGLSLCFIFFIARELLAAVMTEWMALCLLFLVFGTWVGYFRSQSFLQLCFHTLICVALILCRPVFVFLLLSPIVLLAQQLSLDIRAQDWQPAAQRFLLWGLCLVPIIFWIALNFFQLRLAALSIAGTASMFGVVSSLGPLEESQSDSEGMKNFTRSLNSRLLQIPAAQIGKVLSSDGHTIFVAVSKNAESLRDVQIELALPWHEICGYLRTHIWRSLQKYHEGYLAFVLGGLSSLCTTGLLLVPALFLPMYQLYRGRVRPLALATVLFLATHVAHVLLICLVGVIHLRYYNLTYYPLFGVCLLCVMGFASNMGRRGRSH